MNLFIVSLFQWMVYGYLIGVVVNLIDREDVIGGVVGTVVFAMIGGAFSGLLIHAVNTDFDAFTLQGVLAGATGACIAAILHRLVFHLNQYRIPKLTLRNRYFLNVK